MSSRLRSARSPNSAFPRRRSSGSRRIRRHGLQEQRESAMVILAALLAGGAIVFAQLPRDDRLMPMSLEPSAVQTTTVPSAEATPSADISTLLQSIVATRSEMPAAVGSCANVGSDVSALQQVVAERNSDAAQAVNLQGEPSSAGSNLMQALVSMTQSMSVADNDYLTWAQQAQSSGTCTDVTESDVTETGTIGTDNQNAANAKRAFVALWNPCAQQAGQQTYTWKDF